MAIEATAPRLTQLNHELKSSPFPKTSLVSPTTSSIVGVSADLFNLTGDLGVTSLFQSLTRGTSSEPPEPGPTPPAREITPEVETEHPEEIERGRRRAVCNRRVSKLAGILADALDQPPEWQEKIQEAAPLHDLGKLWVADEILDKPGPLTDKEFEEVKKHTLVGGALLSGRDSGPMEMAGRIARSHHERWDGEGYPDGLEGTDIPLSARIVAVADAFDAMTHDRPYRDALPVEKAFSILDEEAGTEFDPQVCAAALRRREEMAALV